MKMAGGKKSDRRSEKSRRGSKFWKKVIGGKMYPPSTSSNGIALRKIILDVSWKLKDNQKYI